MKVNGFQVEEHGSGYQVTLRVHVGAGEPLGISIRDNFSAQDLLRRMAGELLEDDEEREHAPDAKPDGAPAGRRRRGSRPANEAAASPVGEVKPSESPTKPAPTAGRRSGRGMTASSAPHGQDATKTSSGSGRRRKRGEEKPAANPTDAAPTAGRRSNRAKAASASSAKTKSPSKKKRGKAAAEISDEDLTRATSQAAQELSPGAVMDVLEQFEVAEIRDLDQGQRTKFVASLQEARDAA